MLKIRTIYCTETRVDSKYGLVLTAILQDSLAAAGSNCSEHLVLVGQAEHK